MAWQLLQGAWDADIRPPARKLVLLALADLADLAGECWPGVEFLSARCGLTCRQVRRHLSALAHLGHISLRPRSGRANIYVVTPLTWASGVGVTPTSGVEVTPTSGGADIHDRGGVTPTSGGADIHDSHTHHRSVTDPPPTPQPPEPGGGQVVADKKENEIEEYLNLALRFGACRSPAGLRRHLQKNGLTADHRAQMSAWRGVAAIGTTDLEKKNDAYLSQLSALGNVAAQKILEARQIEF